MTLAPLRRVVVTGSESTGKTTLARELAALLAVLWVPEQARTYASSAGRPLTSEDVSPIASVQIAAEDAAIAEATKAGHEWLVLDTDLVSTVVYARHYYGVCPAWIEAEARARLADLYLLADIDIPWTDDSVRDRPTARHDLHEAFQMTLEELGAQVCVVSGRGKVRLDDALRCISTTN